MRLGETDPLTGAHTRAGLDTMLAALRAAASPHAVVLIDVDAFGAYNDRCGRDSGDRLLIALAGLVGRECREGDVVARAGADEFALVLPGSTTDAGRAAAVRIVEAVADWGHEDIVTVSAGRRRGHRRQRGRRDAPGREGPGQGQGGRRGQRRRRGLSYAPSTSTIATAAAMPREWVIDRSIVPAPIFSANASVRPLSRTFGFGRPAISISCQVK